MDFTPVAAAGFTQGEFAKVAGVSRVTVNSWVRGRMKPHRYITERIRKLLQLIQRAVDEGTLPLPDNVEWDKRVAEANRVLDKVYASA